MQNSKPSALRKTLCTFEIPSVCGSWLLGCSFFSTARWCLCLSFPSPCCPFILCCGGSDHPTFRSLSEGIIPYIAVDFLSPKEEVSSGSSYSTILNSIKKKKKKVKYFICALLQPYFSQCKKKSLDPRLLCPHKLTSTRTSSKHKL